MDFCNNIETIPQFSAICWFNAILTSCLYSDDIRTILTNKAFEENWNQENGYKLYLYMVLYYIQQYKNNYDNELEREKINLELAIYLQKYNTDRILLEYLYEEDKELYNFFKSTPEKINFGYYNIYIINFLKKLLNNDVMVILLISIKNKDVFIADTNNILNFYNEEFNIETKIYENKDIKSNIIIYISEYWNNIINYKNVKKNKQNFFDTNLIFNNDMKNFSLNTKNYYLKSCLICDTLSKHSITNIICDNNEYIYNGWPDFYHNNLNIYIPCKFIKNEIDFINDKEFCIENSCKISEPNKEYFCYNFYNSQQKIPIYVKENNRSEDILSKNNRDITLEKERKENLIKILKDFYDFEFLTISEIKNRINDIKFSIYTEYTIIELFIYILNKINIKIEEFNLFIQKEDYYISEIKYYKGFIRFNFIKNIKIYSDIYLKIIINLFFKQNDNIEEYKELYLFILLLFYNNRSEFIIINRRDNIKDVLINYKINIIDILHKLSKNFFKEIEKIFLDKLKKYINEIDLNLYHLVINEEKTTYTDILYITTFYYIFQNNEKLLYENEEKEKYLNKLNDLYAKFYDKKIEKNFFNYLKENNNFFKYFCKKKSLMFIIFLFLIDINNQYKIYELLSEESLKEILKISFEHKHIEIINRKDILNYIGGNKIKKRIIKRY